jgi:hypothetical protein
MENSQVSGTTEKKTWEIPWTIDQLKAASSSWSLAGNAGVSLNN